MFSFKNKLLSNFRLYLTVLSLPVGAALLIPNSQADDTELQILTTIAPIHSLATSLFGEHAEVMILSKGGSSPHGRNLKPSDLKKIKKADLVVQVGPMLEGSLQKTLESNKAKENILTLMALSSINLYDLRSGGVWGEGHNHAEDHGDEHANHDDHDDHADHEEHADHDDHADHEEHADHDDHADHEEHADHDDHADHEEHADHDDHADHEEHANHDDEHALDPHFWLDVNNAKEIVKAMSKAASDLNPSLKEKLAKNEQELLQNLDQLDKEVRSKVSSVSDVSYLVFHDAYQYFEKAYHLNPAGAVLLDPERQLGAKRVSELKSYVKENSVKCVFSEPQFDARILNVLREDTTLKLAELDPIGLDLAPGVDLYPTLLKNLGQSLSDCLSD